jgi:uncharacterized protein involved in outer membrane biogenesis
MRTAFKILAGAGILLLVLVIGIFVIVSTIDVAALIGPIQTRVKAATGRDLAVRGGGRIALSLHPKVVLSDVTLSNAPWATTPQMLTAQRLELELALLPLLSRRLELIEFALVGPVIALETNAKGEKNWEVVRAPESSAPVPVPAPAAAATVFGVGNVEITNGSVTYRDAGSSDVTRVTIDRLFLRGRDPAAPMAAEFRGKINEIPLAVEGTLGPLDALLQQRWPYPVSLQGEVAGRKAAVSTKLLADDKGYKLDELRIVLGANALTGSFAVVTGGPRPKFVFDLTGPTLALNELPLPVAVASPPPAKATKSATWLFPDVPVDFSLLRLFDAEGSLATGRLTLAGGTALESPRVQMTLSAGKLDVPKFSTAIWGGTFAGSIKVDAGQSGSTGVTVHADGKGLSLEALLTAAGVHREVRGGKTDITLNLTMHGVSPHAWASTATGTVLAVAGPATLASTKLDLGTPLDSLLNAVNPFRTTDPSTELVCSVVRLPLANGVARVDRSIAMETAKLGVSASGTLDFRNETLDLGFQPKVKKGITVPVPNFASLVRFAGPFRSPQVHVDAAGSAAAIASIGAAIGTGGWSLVGQTLLSWAEGGGPGPCQVALGAPAGKSTSASAKGDQPSSLTGEVGKALGTLFGK